MNTPHPPRSATCLLLTAGLGTRLRPLTCVRAKPAVPVNGAPLVHRVLRWLVASGHREVVLNLHYRPETVAGIVGDGSEFGARVRFSWEQPVLGSAGGPRHALSLLADTFLIVNGDTLTDVNLQALSETHARAGARVTMALIPNPRPDKYGGVTVSDDGWVTGFVRRGAADTSFHFVGVQMASASTFADLPDGVAAESVGALYPRLIAQDPRSVRAYVCDAAFDDIGTPDDYLRTAVRLAGREGDRLAAGARVRIHETARLARTAVWDDVTIGAGVSLVDCIVGDGASVPDGARYERCAIVPASACGAAPDGRVEGALLVAPF